MPTMEDYAKQPRERRIERLTRTPDDLAAAIAGQAAGAMSRRPDATNWAAKEIVCHLRDTEEAFAARMVQVLAMDVDPKIVAIDPARWAEERQYLATDTALALAAFRRRRAETLELFERLVPAEWDKGAIHPVAGRLTLDAFVTVIAWHDDNHLEQLARALLGRP